jgi:hypothetical protein
MSELAWAAGFFDGEGSTNLANPEKSRPCDLQVQLGQKDRRPLDRFAAVLGGRVGGPYRDKQGNEAYRLTYGGMTARAVIEALFPYLSAPKREQAQAVFASIIEPEPQARINGRFA